MFPGQIASVVSTITLMGKEPVLSLGGLRKVYCELFSVAVNLLMIGKR